MSFDSIIDDVKNTPSLESLTASIMLNDTLGWENYALETYECGRVLTQKWWELGQTSVIYAILKKVIFFLASHLCYAFQNMSNVFIDPIQCIHSHLTLSHI